MCGAEGTGRVVLSDAAGRVCSEEWWLGGPRRVDRSGGEARGVLRGGVGGARRVRRSGGGRAGFFWLNILSGQRANDLRVRVNSFEARSSRKAKLSKAPYERGETGCLRDFIFILNCACVFKLVGTIFRENHCGRCIGSRVSITILYFYVLTCLISSIQ